MQGTNLYIPRGTSKKTDSIITLWRRAFFNAITWEISARAETECEGGNRCFLYLLLYTRVLRMRLWIFSPGWNILAITWRNFRHVIAKSIFKGFVRGPGLKFQPDQTDVNHVISPLSVHNCIVFVKIWNAIYLKSVNGVNDVYSNAKEKGNSKYSP